MIGTFDIREHYVKELCENVLNTFDTDVGTPDILQDIDPDAQFFNTPEVQTSCCNSLYYYECGLNDMLKKIGTRNENFSFLHLNIRSAFRNLDSLLQYLDNINHRFGIIGLSKTWCNECNVGSLNVKGYTSEHTYKVGRTGGGVSMLINEQFVYKRRKIWRLTMRE